MDVTHAKVLLWLEILFKCMNQWKKNLKKTKSESLLFTMICHKSSQVTSIYALEA